MISLLVPALALALAQGQPATPFTQHGKLALRNITANRPVVPRYGKLDLTLDLSATYDNPFDPDDVDVWAIFTGPGGRSMRINGFLDQDFTRKLDNGVEMIEPAGKPVWRVRFAPDAVGNWSYRVTAKDRTGTIQSAVRRVKVIASSDPGFVGRSKRNPGVFAFAGEKPYFAVGENMCWGGKAGSFDYDRWLPALHKAGGNWIRIWMSSWNCALEWGAKPQGENRSGNYYGVGVYSLDNAWKLDRILDTAEQNGVFVMLCFGTYGEFNVGGYFNEGQWKANPYNVANGGPCQKPEEFVTNEQARKLYRRRLRYIAARYGWRTNIHSWEFWNEFPAPAKWVGEMARYMKGTGEFAGQGADPYHHLLTTTYGDDAVWRLPEIGFTQTHSYGTGNIPDHGVVAHSDALAHAGYQKPHLLGEFGIDWRGPDNKYDPENKGVNLHNAMWAALASGDGGTSMIWWWDGYIHPLNLYPQFAPVRKFADSVPWTKGDWKPLGIDPAQVRSGPESFSDLVIPAMFGWGKSGVTDFTVTPQGLKNSAALPQFLFSTAKADMRTTPMLHVNYKAPGKFAIHVDEVSDAAKVRFLLDGKLVRELDLHAAPPVDPGVKPEYESTQLMREYNMYRAKYNKDYSIDVPAGEHTITLDNAGGDWASIESIRLQGYRSSRMAAVNVYGQTNGSTAVLWAQNGAHSWKNVAERKPIPLISGAETVIHGLPAGRYAIEWWDTHNGTVTRREQGTCTSDGLPLRLPDLEEDVAARITRL